MSLVRGTSKTRRPIRLAAPWAWTSGWSACAGRWARADRWGLCVAEVDQAAAGVGGDRPAGRPRRGRDARLTVGQGPDRPIRVAVAVTREGHRRAPGRWAGEGVGHWLHALTPVARPRRGRRAGGVRDGLTGPLDAITRPGRARPREAAMSPDPTGAGRKRRMMRGKSALDARKSPPAAARPPEASGALRSRGAPPHLVDPSPARNRSAHRPGPRREGARCSNESFEEMAAPRWRGGPPRPGKPLKLVIANRL